MRVVTAGGNHKLGMPQSQALVLPRQIIKLLREAPPRAPLLWGLMRPKRQRWSARLVVLTLVLAAAFLML
jgi:hypothetical protein